MTAVNTFGAPPERQNEGTGEIHEDSLPPTKRTRSGKAKGKEISR